MKAKITRETDGVSFTGSLNYIDWDDYGVAVMTSHKPIVGSSVCIDCENAPNYTWLTSTITELISEYEVITENSTYKIEVE